MCLPISSSTRQHFVDADNVERVDPYAQVERIFATVFHHVLVAADTGSF